MAQVRAILSARARPLTPEAVLRYVRVGARVAGRVVFLRAVRVPGGTKFLRRDVEKFLGELSGRAVRLAEPPTSAAVVAAAVRAGRGVEYPPARGRGTHGAA